jgi:orotate phosphoribosyltransferase
MTTQYFDTFLAEAEPKILIAVARELQKLIPQETEILAGAELGGVPLVVALSQVTHLPVRFVRKHSKEYGTGRMVEGGPVRGMKVVLVEDLIGSSGSVLQAVKALRAQGAVVRDVVCLIERECGGQGNFSQFDLRFHRLFTINELRLITEQEPELF